MAWVVYPRHGAIQRLAVGAGAPGHKAHDIQIQLLYHLVGELIGCLGVVTAVHPNNGNVRAHLANHVENDRLKGAKVSSTNWA
ncbi:hypothetical protein HSBAA_41940 [Vreelandella sulfidaeris]|uniref:Uncharacterized protein n=1 Tax=Vreelandella sulfidaeris TaxID=115553 RepID=A0A455UF51_9GAMM|nr:hypothetical protein HSBAA_41940 [Halomonas sulfidaeris]